MEKFLDSLYTSLSLARGTAFQIVGSLSLAIRPSVSMDVTMCQRA